MVGGYIVTTFGYSLRGNEGFWVDVDRLRKFIGVGKSDAKQPHVLVAAMGRLKGEDGDRMHVFPLVNVTKSGIRIRVWLERVACLLDFEDRRSCPAFCDESGYQLESKDVEKVFHPILQSIQRNVNFPDLVPYGLDVTVHCRCAR